MIIKIEMGIKTVNNYLDGGTGVVSVEKLCEAIKHEFKDVDKISRSPINKDDFNTEYVYMTHEPELIDTSHLIK